MSTNRNLRVAVGAGLMAVAQLFSAAAFADCPLAEKSLPGITVGADNKPIANAAIVASWSEKRTDVTSRANSDAEGRFTLLIQYSTFTRKSFGGTDVCNGGPPTISVEATAGERRGNRQRVNLEGDVGELKLTLE